MNTNENERKAIVTLDYEYEEQLSTVLFCLAPIIVEHYEIEIPIPRKKVYYNNSGIITV